jgi:ComF family protein
MKINLATYWYDFVDLLFPRCCEACEKALVGSEVILCTNCRATLPRMQTDSALKMSLQSKFIGYPEVKGVYAFLIFTKKGKVQTLLHALKYKGRPEIGVLLGTMMAQEMPKDVYLPATGLIVSVPLHRKRLKERGYNQSDTLAEGLAAVMGTPWSGTLLVRTRYTKSQTGKTKIERHDNVKGIFEVSDAQQVQGRSIILVDDVLTTGATLEACLEALIDAGCHDVYIMTIAAAQQ